MWTVLRRSWKLRLLLEDKEYRDICSILLSVIAAEEYLRSYVSQSNVDREFVMRLKLIWQNGGHFSVRQADFPSKWNDFLHYGYENPYRENCDQANEIFGKGKTLASLTAELLSIAAFAVGNPDPYPVFIWQTLPSINRKCRKCHAEEQNLSYEWKQF